MAWEWPKTTPSRRNGTNEPPNKATPRLSSNWPRFMPLAVALPVGAPKCLVKAGENTIDRHAVPLPHFGVVLEMDAWKTLAARLATDDVDFILEPHVRYKGRVNEQASMMLHDPSGNAIEFKAFADIGRLFAT